MGEVLWEHTGSNRGPSACKADALNQLSYAPLMECKDKGMIISVKFFIKNILKKNRPTPTPHIPRDPMREDLSA